MLKGDDRLDSIAFKVVVIFVTVPFWLGQFWDLLFIAGQRALAKNR